jgi:ParB family transcriptional regulator, chromosome partitioning protein
MTQRPTRGLGRGLASLIPDDALDGESRAPERELRVVPIDEIVPNPVQPRQVFSPDELSSLAASIREHGVLSPLLVRRHEGRYVLVAGERRLRAAALAGLTEVPVLLRDAPEASVQLELALVENLQRTDLDPIESARGFQRLIEQFGYTQDQVATRVGKDRATVANVVRLLKLPDFALAAIRDGRITAGHGRALLPLVDPDEIRRLLGRVVAQQLSVRATEQLVARMVKTQPVITAERKSRERTLEYATKLLEEALHTSVSILARKAGGGRIVIDYADGEHLESLITRLRESAAARARKPADDA